jgi:hypothetical protein
MDFAGWLWISQGGFFILLTFEQRSSLPDESKPLKAKSGHAVAGSNRRSQRIATDLKKRHGLMSSADTHAG